MRQAGVNRSIGESLNRVIDQLVRLVTAIVRLVLGVLAALLAFLADAVAALVAFAPVIARVGCILGVIVSAALSFGPVHQAFGGDVPALIPAVCLMVFPVAAALAFRFGWGGMLAAAVVTFGAGYILPTLSPVARSLVVLAVVTVPFAKTITEVSR